MGCDEYTSFSSMCTEAVAASRGVLENAELEASMFESAKSLRPSLVLLACVLVVSFRVATHTGV